VALAVQTSLLDTERNASTLLRRNLLPPALPELEAASWRGQCFTLGDPAAALNAVDQIVRYFEPGKVATTFVGITRPPFVRMDLAVAGHSAPVLAAPGDTGRYLDLTIAPPLGVEPPRPPQPHRLTCRSVPRSSSARTAPSNAGTRASAPGSTSCARP
jgi:hypothetical protein